MDPVLGRLGLGDALEEQPRPGAVGVDPRGVAVPVLAGQVVGHGPRLPAVEPVRRVLLLVPDRLPPEGGEAGRVGRVEHHLELDGHGESPRSVSRSLPPGCASPGAAGVGGRVDRQLGRGGRPDPVDQAGGGDAAVDRDLDPEPVEQGGEPPGGGVGVGAGELAGGHALADHRGQGLLPAQVELARHLGQLGAAQGLAPGVDPEQPRLRRPGGGVELQDPVQPLGGAAVPGGGRRQPVQVLGGGVPERLPEQGLLVGEVVEHQPGRDPEGGGHVAHPGAGEPAGDHLTAGRPEDLLPADIRLDPRHGRSVATGGWSRGGPPAYTD